MVFRCERGEMIDNQPRCEGFLTSLTKMWRTRNYDES